MFPSKLEELRMSTGRVPRTGVVADVSEIEALLYALAPKYVHLPPDEVARRYSRALDVGLMRLEGRTYREIASDLGISRTRANQMAWRLTERLTPEACHRDPYTSQKRERRRKRLRDYVWAWAAEDELLTATVSTG